MYTYYSIIGVAFYCTLLLNRICLQLYCKHYCKVFTHKYSEDILFFNYFLSVIINYYIYKDLSMKSLLLIN